MIGYPMKGKEAIEEYVGRPWATIEHWINEKFFPAIFLNGEWESHSKLIDDWRARQLEGKPQPVKIPLDKVRPGLWPGKMERGPSNG